MMSKAVVSGQWSVVSKVLFLLLLLLLLPGAARAQEPPEGDVVTVTAAGMAALTDDPAAAEDEALWDAKRNAVEQAAGVFLRAHTEAHNFQIDQDDIESLTRGFIRSWTIVPGSRRVEDLEGNGRERILHIEVQATVALMPLIRRLADIADVYNDLERPRLLVRVESADQDTESAQAARQTLIARLQSEGFEIAQSGPAEIELTARLRTTPTVRLGDSNSPYGVGASMAACRARLALQVVSTASEEVLFTVASEGDGQSFQSDEEARREAAADATDALLQASQEKFVQRLLARWAHERYEGHVVVIQATGLDARERTGLRAQVRAMRDFCRFTGEQTSGRRWSLHFLTRLATRDVRRRLTGLQLEGAQVLRLLNDRGPIITCRLDEETTFGRGPRALHRAVPLK